ncbi:ImmA/IrrE family metallo-endopeptidase [Sphingobium sp. 3R8]|uniref:ImmA/IrrE family metallo-endopeptidase n=1 Tax=Sphingobium sp. 3R8 TaxID=2874921 RepID=UPI001CCF45CF|nr:ImmA/IrrE family metallo-endopeptidase [Sphingobium sp. 3R8]MBZ9650346.1 ImmA/IrrE family metallo-endopeptidase [Sphingobium sp. 3R8]
MHIDRMDLDACRTPATIVAEILRQVPDMPVPVPIEELATAVDITDIRRLETPNFEGGLITQPERRDGMILVNSTGSAQRQRYTIGHELGHYLMVSHQPATAGGAFMCSSSDMTVRKADRDNRAARMEAEANRFSANMLMPLTRFRPDMEALGSPDLDSIFALAIRYDMSREATSIHYTSHHDEMCAIVLSKDGVVRRIYRPSRFPFIDAPINKPLPTPSCAARFNPSKSGWGEVDGGVWLGGRHGAGRTLREQVHRASGGWTYSLLVLEDVGRDSSEDSEESELEDVFDRFSRRGDSDR